VRSDGDLEKVLDIIVRVRALLVGGVHSCFHRLGAKIDHGPGDGIDRGESPGTSLTSKESRGSNGALCIANIIQCDYPCD